VDTTRIVFDCPVSPWVVGTGALVALVGAAIVVRRDTARLHARRRWGILILVCTAALLLAGIVLSPTLIRTWPDPQRARCVVLVDGSRSMLLNDTYGPRTADWIRGHCPDAPKGTGRADAHRTNPGAKAPRHAEAPAPNDPSGRRWRRDAVARALLVDQPGTWLAQLRARFDVSGFRFARELTGLALGEGTSPFEVDPNGYATAVGEALDTSVGAGGTGPVAGVVLVSDGASNTGRDPSEAARVLGRSGTPVFVVGVGDPDPPRDVAVVALRAPKSALLGDELLLSAQITTTGLAAQRVNVDLTCQGEPCARKAIVTRPTGRPVHVTFSHVPTGPGRHVFAVRVAGVPGEQNLDNNIATAQVDVAERRIRVLLVESEPRWEFRFLRNVLERAQVSWECGRPGRDHRNVL